MAEIREGVEVDITCGTKQIRISLLILPSTVDDIFLGMDFLTAKDASFRCGEDEFSLGRNRRTSKTATVRITKVVEHQEITEEKVEQVLTKELCICDKIKWPSNITKPNIIMKDENPFGQRYFPTNLAEQRINSGSTDKLSNAGCNEPSHSPYSSPTILAQKGKAMLFGLNSTSATLQLALDQIIGPEMEPYAFDYVNGIIITGKSREEHKSNFKEVFQKFPATNARMLSK